MTTIQIVAGIVAFILFVAVIVVLRVMWQQVLDRVPRKKIDADPVEQIESDASPGELGAQPQP